MKKKLLHAESIVKSFSSLKQEPLLNGISLEIFQGDTLAITGRSGEGKTTLLHILGTLEPFDRGELWIQGEKVVSSNRDLLRNRHIGFVFQAFHLLEDFSLLDNVLMPSIITKQNKGRDWGLFLLEQVGLSERADSPVRVLSGGQKQKVAIARALCNDPELIFADEPSGNLDDESAGEIGDLLFEMSEQKQKGLLIVTHNRELASRCDKTHLLEKGSLL